MSDNVIKLFSGKESSTGSSEEDWSTFQPRNKRSRRNSISRQKPHTRIGQCRSNPRCFLQYRTRSSKAKVDQQAAGGAQATIRARDRETDRSGDQTARCDRRRPGEEGKPSSPSSQARPGTGEPARKASSPFRVRPRGYPQDSGSVRGGSLVKRRRRSVRKRNRQRLAAHARRMRR